jgi:SAM-dependent MidA family methyltransferase
MWHLLGDPPVFQVIEVGSGDGALAQSIVDACRRMAPRLAQVLYYVAADYEPCWLQSPDHTFDWNNGTGDWTSPIRQDPILGIQSVKTEGLRPFQNVVGCILCNELIDNFPVHRFAIQDGRVKEIFVTSAGGNLTEVLDEPSSPRIEKRLTSLGLSLTEGYRGEVNLAMEDWTRQITRALDRGFILSIDYGQLATDLYSPQNAQGTLVCYDRHVVSSDPYQHIGQQDITCQVDFTSLMRLGDRHGLTTVGYALQSQFLTNLGFSSFLDALQTQGLSPARTALSRMAMMTLVDSDEYGDFKVLAQAKGNGLGIELLGFEGQER